MYERRSGGGRGLKNNTNNNHIGVASDGPGRGGFNSSGYRKFDRGFGRGRGRYFQSPQPLRKDDMFMEAGRLAAEYLVAKGMLPMSALPSKFQNPPFTNEVGGFQEFRPQDGEYMQPESRIPALARLGSFEQSSDRKQCSDDYGASGTKNNMKGEREKGSLIKYDSERGRENGMSCSMSGRLRTSSDDEADDDALSVHCDEQLTTKDDEQNVKADELAQKSYGTENSLTETVTVGKDCEDMTNMEGDKESDDFGKINMENKATKESKNKEVTGQHSPIEDSDIQPSHVATTTTTSQKGNALLQLCNFAKVPTRTRSLRSKGLKGKDFRTIEEENISAGTSTDVDVAKSIDSDVIDGSIVNPLIEQTPSIEERTSTVTPLVTENLVYDDDTVVSLFESNAVLDQNLDLSAAKTTSMDESDPSFGKAISLDHDGSADAGKNLETLSFPVGSFSYLEESSQGQQDINCPGSVDEYVATERSEKRVLEKSEVGGTFKKPKAWHPSMIGLVHLSNEGSIVIEHTSPRNNLMMIPQESTSRNLGFTAPGNDNSMEYAEAKQMVDSSFKICDLNLIEGSHMDDSYSRSQMMFFPSMSGIKRDPLYVDGGLNIGDSSNFSRQYNTTGTHGKEVQVINLDDNFVDDGVFNPGEKRKDAVYTGMESFPGQPRGNIDQDGYGFMISELLGNEIPNCSTVAGDISSLHNNMDLHNEQGMLPDDDPIYMTLGEIPISMSGFWEPPNPEFGKPF